MTQLIRELVEIAIDDTVDRRIKTLFAKKMDVDVTSAVYPISQKRNEPKMDISILENEYPSL